MNLLESKLSNPQRTMLEALKRDGFSANDALALLREVRKPAEQAALAARRERIAAQILAATFAGDSVNVSYSVSALRVAGAIDYANELIAQLDGAALQEEANT